MCLKEIATMRKNLACKWLMAVLLAGLWSLPAAAQNRPTGAPSAAESATPQLPSSASIKLATVKAAQNEPSEPVVKGPIHPVVGVSQLLKMLQAGVSKEVMKTYIETAQVASPPSAADIITLKEHGLADDLTEALIKRGAELTAQASQARASNAVPARASSAVSLDALVAALRGGQFSSGHLDPEGYDYFRYYYLYPRTIASANERLFSSPPFSMYPPYSAGYYSPWGFRPGPFPPQFPGP
jgi:hypothetical protein